MLQYENICYSRERKYDTLENPNSENSQNKQT